MKIAFNTIFFICLIIKQSIPQATTILCIAGGTGSGKTTIANKLKDSIQNDVVIISQDSYYRDLSYMTNDEKENVNFDHPDSIEFELLKDHLQALKSGNSVQVPTYDFSSHTRTDCVHQVDPESVIILEGILVLAVPEIRNLTDIKVFLDVEDDIRLIRRIQRDIEERSRTIAAIQKQYLTTVKPMHEKFVAPSKRFADIIIPHGSENPVAVEVLVSQLKRAEQ